MRKDEHMAWQPTTAGSAMLAIAAGAVHLVLAGPHFAEHRWLGALFVLDGLALVGAGAAVLAGLDRARPLMSGLCAATAAAWLASVTVGLPGAHAHPPEAVGAVTTLVEVVAATLWALRASPRRRAVVRAAAVCMATVLSASALTVAAASPGELVETAARHEHGEGPDQEAVSASTESSRPEACLAVTRKMTLYAEELPRKNGAIRLGWGLTPGTAKVPGPLIEMVEGECLAVTVVNRVPEATLRELREQHPVGEDPSLPLGVSLHVHGVKYTRESDGTMHHGSIVPPGRSRTFVWYAAPRAVGADRLPSLGTAGYWWYHDHVAGTTHGTGGLAAGLFGGLVVRRPGDIRPDRSFTVVLGQNATINHRKEWDFCLPGQTEGIVPGDSCFAARKGERVEFVVFAIGDDFHTFHLHAHTWADNRTGIFTSQADGTRLVDVKTIGPSESFGFQLIAGEEVGAGDWMLHCHVQAHSDAGMATYFKVLNPDGSEAPPLPGSIEHAHAPGGAHR